MSGKIFILQDTEISELQEVPFEKEYDFQRLIERYPNILAGDQIDPENPRKWLLVSREMPIPSESGGRDRWSIDHLFLDQDGIPTLVEVKRGTNPQLRREVVGQMLEYAANAVKYWRIERIPTVKIPEDKIQKYPSFSIKQLEEEKHLDVFIDSINNHLDDIKAIEMC